MEKELKPGRFLKTRIVEEYAERLKDSTSIIVTEFKGITNKQLEDLRKRLSPVSARYMIIKCSMCKQALESLKMQDVNAMLGGSCALSYGDGDAASITKVLANFTKENKNLILKGGYIDGQILTADTLKELAALPPREVLIARLLSAMNSPVTGFVAACSGILKKIVYALNEIAKKKGGEENG
ncbi:MAG: 50S ribosomal protein L10 [Candidatus Omnitrophica bacterium]|nr:50S ribosomal protein L10 [Candidatus Omnitrophota bacterium]